MFIWFFLSFFLRSVQMYLSSPFTGSIQLWQNCKPNVFLFLFYLKCVVHQFFFLHYRCINLYHHCSSGFTSLHINLYHQTGTFLRMAKAKRYICIDGNLRAAVPFDWFYREFKVAGNSFQYFSRLKVWWVIITTLYSLTPTSWYQQTVQSSGNKLLLILLHNRLPWQQYDLPKRP